MRIKQYDYDTCVKLKNPMRDYNEVKKWVASEFIEEFTKEVQKNEFVRKYVLNNISVLRLYRTDESLIFYNGDSLIYSLSKFGNTFYGCFLDDYNFEDLKKMFLNYKLKQKLEKDLVVNEVKRKITKI